jgi:hypothetical protein
LDEKLFVKSKLERFVGQIKLTGYIKRRANHGQVRYLNQPRLLQLADIIAYNLYKNYTLSQLSADKKQVCFIL